MNCFYHNDSCACLKLVATKKIFNQMCLEYVLTTGDAIGSGERKDLFEIKLL